MYDVTWYSLDDSKEQMERYDNEIDARQRYDELVNSKKCQSVQIVYLISNWSIED